MLHSTKKAGGASPENRAWALPPPDVDLRFVGVEADERAFELGADAGDGVGSREVVGAGAGGVEDPPQGAGDMDGDDQAGGLAAAGGPERDPEVERAGRVEGVGAGRAGERDDAG